MSKVDVASQYSLRQTGWYRGPMEMQIRCAERWDANSHYRAQLADFLGAIRERRAPFVTAESALRALAVIEAAYAGRTPMAQPWLARIGASK